jgi:hypothetical protein
MKTNDRRKTDEKAFVTSVFKFEERLSALASDCLLGYLMTLFQLQSVE